MRKTIYIFVAASTFICGIIAFHLFPAAKTVSLCEARSYDGQEIHVRAYFDVVWEDGDQYPDTISSFEDGCFQGANLVYSEELKKDVKLKQFRQEMIEANRELYKDKFDKGWNLAEVEIYGEVEDLSHDGITHCFSPDLSIKVKEIKQISPIHFVGRESVK